MSTPAPLDLPATVSLRDLYRHVWHHAHGARARFALAMSMLAGSQLLKLAMPWMAAQAIDAVQAGGAHGLAPAARWIAGVVGLMAAVWLLHGPARVIERNVGLRVRRRLADTLYGRLAAAPLAWHERHHSGELQHRVQQAGGALYDFTQNQFIYLQNAVNLVGPLAALALLSPLTGVLAGVGYVAIGAVIVAFDRALMQLAEHENHAERRYAARLLDFAGNVGSLLALRLQPAARRLLDARLAGIFVPLKRSIVLNEWKWCGVDLLTIALAWGLVAAYAVHARAGGAVMLGSLFMVYQYAQQAAGVVGSMASNYQNFARTKTDFASAAPIWHAPVVAPPATALPAGWHRVAIAGLDFERAAADVDDSRRWGLHGVALTLHRGERLALVGASGSGKSTLLRVLAGLYAADRAQISVDGRATPLAQLAASATLIPQEAEVFESSLRENLAFGEPVDEAALLLAAHVSAFDEVLQALPDGLETAIGERGANLSGGQRQRLALARGVLAARGRSLLLLDEPTSALDPLTEARVHERLRLAFPDACIVAAVHRLSLLAHFDRVALMADGRLLDVGSVAELAARQPLFARMLQGAGDAAGAPAVEPTGADAATRGQAPGAAGDSARVLAATGA
jgi:ABC-type multidrug transport system fused ATPase/permease subunit